MPRSTFVERVNLKLAERGISPRAASLRAGLSADFLRTVERRDGSPGAENARRIADVLQCSVAWLLGETDVDTLAVPESQKPELVRVVGEVRASNFRTAFEIPDSEQGVLWLPPDLRYPGVQRFALKVSGPSMNEIAADGATIICANFTDLDRRLSRRPRHGDIVVVQRWHHELVEATCKALAERSDGMWLEPRTTALDIPAIHVSDADGNPIEKADQIVIHALVLTVLRDL